MATSASSADTSSRTNKTTWQGREVSIVTNDFKFAQAQEKYFRNSR